MSRVSHVVYFTLADAAPERVAEMVDACRKYLNVQPGILFFAAGPRGAEFDRPVNVLDWHVGLHLVFADKPSHDAYQDDPTHNRFIDEMKANWANVRVFDAYV